MKKTESKCILCGNTYEYCPVCDHKLPAWMSLYDTDNCRMIFNITRDYVNKVISSDKAKELLAKCDLTNKDNFRKQNLLAIDEILKEPEIQIKPTARRSYKKKIETVKPELDNE